MKKEQYELIMLDFWEEYNGQTADVTTTSAEDDNAFGDAGGWDT